jgi:hypothetical protein
VTKEWVLVTADGPQLRDPLVAIRALAAAGYRPALAVSCGSNIATSSRYCLRRIDVPRCDDPGFVEAIRREMDRGPYLTVLPASEAALLALGVSTPDLVDKVKLAQAAEAAGIASPPSRTFLSASELLDAADDLHYPVIVKPSVHRSNAAWVESPADLRGAVVQDGPVMVQPFLQDLNAVSGVVWKGRLVAAVHERWFRIWKYRCGVASAAVTVPADIDREQRMLRLLDGYEGYFHAQFAGPYLLDLNLRVHTSHPMAMAAGVNLVGVYCDLLRGVNVPSVRGRPGVYFRWLEGDIRHLGKAVRHRDMSIRSAIAALRPRRGTAHSTESIVDPVPMISRMRYVAGLAARSAWARRDGHDEWR